MKNTIILSLLLASISTMAGDLFLDRTAHIWFYSDAPMEKIEAHNHQCSAMLKKSEGTVAFKVVMKGFEFEKALMQEHFNENYVESDKFPNATFDGSITNLGEINFGKDGKYDASVKGKLKIHGEEIDLEDQGTIEVKGETIAIQTEFNITLADFGIKIPQAVVKNIAETVKITVDAKLTEYSR